jgi:endonuclease/exonuclease/phosphatase family metal-dependent hydrolase
MTWNVRYFGHGAKGLRASAGWTGRLARAIASLPDLPHVVALQEVETRSLRAGLAPEPQLDRFQALLNAAARAEGHRRRYEALYFPAHRYALPTGPALYTTGLAFLVCDGVEVLQHNALAPFPITHVRPGRLSWLKQTRVAAHLRLAVADGAVDLFNTHLSLPAFLEVGPHRVPSRMGHGTNQLAEVGSLLGFMEAHRGGPHAVLVGDFNAAPGSPVYRAIGEAGLVDAQAAFTGRRADALRPGTARFMHLRMHLDHVFSTPAVRWRRFTQHRVDGAGAFAGLSDHAPKIGRLALE